MNKLADAYMDTLAPYVEPENAILDLDARITGLELLVQQQALNMLSMAQRLRDFTAESKSSIIMPDRFN